MVIALILMIAVLVGAAVWALSTRREQWLIGEPEDRRRWGPRPADDTSGSPDEETGDSFAYGRPARAGHHARPSERTPIRTRLLGLIGLILMVAFGALALAIAMWEAGHLINQTISKFLER